MRRPFDILTFDCYGTLIDWESGHARSSSKPRRRTESRSRPPPPSPPTPRSSRTSRQGRTAATGRCWRPRRCAWQSASIGPWRRSGRARSRNRSPPGSPFPTRTPGWRDWRRRAPELGILSNMDDDLLAATLLPLHGPFRPARHRAAGQVEYKPGPRHFEKARERMGKNRWLHVARGPFHDIVPAFGLGIPVAWINRKGQAAHPTSIPDMEVKTLGRPRRPPRPTHRF